MVIAALNPALKTGPQSYSTPPPLQLKHPFFLQKKDAIFSHKKIYIYAIVIKKKKTLMAVWGETSSVVESHEGMLKAQCVNIL